ncbi:hypothetical protein [Neptuniibacter sp. QD37_11]|uniref:hypothetical protein n=1 Tax=Neptuniibacter sp. QD37_11 TaxID=3398209 RepID=UPI0039F54284
MKKSLIVLALCTAVSMPTIAQEHSEVNGHSRLADLVADREAIAELEQSTSSMQQAYGDKLEVLLQEEMTASMDALNADALGQYASETAEAIRDSLKENLPMDLHFAKAISQQYRELSNEARKSGYIQNDYLRSLPQPLTTTRCYVNDNNNEQLVYLDTTTVITRSKGTLSDRVRVKFTHNDYDLCFRLPHASKNETN